MAAYLYDAGLFLLGGVFAWVGIEHFLRFETIAAQLAEQDFPAPRLLLTAGSIVEIIAGVCLAAGLAVPYAAAALIAFTIAANMLVLTFWRYSGPQRLGLRSAFIVNFAVVGGLLAVAAQTH